MLRIELRELLAQSGEARATPQCPVVAGHAGGRLGRQRPGHAARVRPPALVARARGFAVAPGPAPAQRRGRLRPAVAGRRRLGACRCCRRLRGRAQLDLEPSRLAGVPLSGSLALQTAANGKTTGQLQLDADGNRLRADARLDGLAEGSGDHWDLKAEMPALKKLQPLWKLLLGAGQRCATGRQAQCRGPRRRPLAGAEHPGQARRQRRAARRAGAEARRGALDAGQRTATRRWTRRSSSTS